MIDDVHRCDPGYEQCVDFSRTIKRQRAEIERLQKALENAENRASYWQLLVELPSRTLQPNVKDGQ